MPKTSAGILLFRKPPGRRRSPARPSGRPVLAEEGRRRLVDPERPRRRRRGPGSRPRGANFTRRRARRFWANSSTSGRTDSRAARRSSPSPRGRLRSRLAQEQHVRHGVAAPVRARRRNSRKSTGRLGFPSTRRCEANREGAAADPRPRLAETRGDLAAAPKGDHCLRAADAGRNALRGTERRPPSPAPVKKRRSRPISVLSPLRSPACPSGSTSPPSLSRRSSSSRRSARSPS